MSKTLNTKEAMQALLDGKKITTEELLPHKAYIYLNDSTIVDSSGLLTVIGAEDYFLYEEPKPKKQVWQWRVKPYNSPITWSVCSDLFTEEGAKEAFNSLRYEKHAGPFEVEE